MTQRVTNINIEQITPNGHGSWLEYWEFVTGHERGVCAELTCGKLASEGALVQKEGSRNKTWYVVPLCPRHNAMRGGQIDIVGYIPMAVAEKEKAEEP